MMTRTEILQHYKDFFYLNELGTGEDDMIYIDWAEALLEDAKVVNKNALLADVSGCYCKVSEKEPPHNVELIAKAPNETKHLTSWRPEYGIFCCQHKKESAFDWEWLVV